MRLGRCVYPFGKKNHNDKGLRRFNDNLRFQFPPFPPGSKICSVCLFELKKLNKNLLTNSYSMIVAEAPNEPDLGHE